MSKNLVLVVDDSQDIRTLVSRLLTMHGYRVVEARNGPEAIRLARSHRPNLILMDLGLPGMDGWEVTENLRTDPALEEIPIIAMTAYTMSTVVQTAQRAGCQRVVFKPFELEAIVREVHSFTAPIPTHAPGLAYA